MKRSKAKKIVIQTHLGDILSDIKLMAKDGVSQNRFYGLTSTQVNFLKELGYGVDEFNRKFDPLRHDVVVSWE